MYLRDAAQRVSVLYAVVLAVGKDFGAFGEQAEVFSNLELTFVPANQMHTLVVSVEQTGQRFEGHRTDDVCQLSSTETVVPCQGTDRSHGAGAVGHAQTFFVNQCFNRLDACFCHRFGSVHLNALVNGSAFAQHRQGHVCQRSQGRRKLPENLSAERPG